MKLVKFARKGILLVVSVAGLSFLAFSSFGAEERRITTEEEYRKLVVGKRVVADWGWVRVHGDARITGVVNGKNLTGAWIWVDRFYCRTVQIGARNLGRDCQIVLIDGDKVSYIRDQGNGRKVTYQLERK